MASMHLKKKEKKKSSSPRLSKNKKKHKMQQLYFKEGKNNESINVKQHEIHFHFVWMGWVKLLKQNYLDYLANMLVVALLVLKGLINEFVG